MEKVVLIGDKELKLKSSLLTIVSYKNIFGTDLFNDIQKMDITNKKQIANMTHVIQTLFQIIYVLHKPYTKLTFEEFLSQFDFDIISDVHTLESISTVIGELLASNKGPGQPNNP